MRPPLWSGYCRSYCPGGQTQRPENLTEIRRRRGKISAHSGARLPGQSELPAVSLVKIICLLYARPPQTLCGSKLAARRITPR
jgi:hypothetical protein